VTEKTPRENAWEAVYALVRRIPQGKVMTYGQIALEIEPLSARAVGWALNCCPDDVPWHRVVNSRGGCSTDRLPHVPTGLQRSLLEREGVRFSEAGYLPLSEYRWFPPA
jgi:methylated-DNA-protein-cysteine methyltransferase-like protein